MRLSVFGLGYVGCVTAACLARSGHQVTGVDVSAEKVDLINAGRSPVVEPGLHELIAAMVRAGRLRATHACREAVGRTEAALICVGTPGRHGGRPELEALRRVGEEIGSAAGRNAAVYTVVLRSTALPGTLENVLLPALHAGAGPDTAARLRVAVNPEFMREGSSLHDFSRPPFTLVGCDDRATASRLEVLYKDVDAPFIRTTVRTAEMVKYVCNAFHALKVSFGNEVGERRDRTDPGDAPAPGLVEVRRRADAGRSRGGGGDRRRVGGGVVRPVPPARRPGGGRSDARRGPADGRPGEGDAGVRRALTLGGTVLAVLVAAGPISARPAAPKGAPEPPRLAVDTAPVAPAGRTLVVAAGGDLQAALDRARPGDVVALEPGAVFRGPFTLPNKEGEGWIVIRTGAPDAALPPPGTRAGPAHAERMPKLEASSGSVVVAARGSHHYRFVGIEIRPRPDNFLRNLVLLGSDETTADRQPHHFIFDRCYIHGDPRLGSRRGIALNSRHTAIVDSHLSDFKEVGADSQAIGGWNGPGPFAIINNRLEGAGENIMFGGTAPALDGVVPADIVIRGNHFHKPLSWKIGDPAYRGTPWSVKNLFELKNARRVLVENNLFENNWAHAQNGFAVLLTVRTELDAAPWAVVEDVVFRNNIVRNVASGFNILGIDDSSASASGRTRSIDVVGNLFVGVGTSGLGGSGTLFQILNGVEGLSIEHNTALSEGPIIAADMAPSPGLVFRDNIVRHNEYGVFGSGRGTGLPALEHYFPGHLFRRNAIVGGPGVRLYPPDNFHPPSIEAVGFVDAGRQDYRLSAASPYKGAATDGSDLGAGTEVLAPAAAGGPSAPEKGRKTRGGGG